QDQGREDGPQGLPRRRAKRRRDHRKSGSSVITSSSVTPVTTTVPRFEELIAPSHWRTVDFISDLHLQASEPATVAAFRHYLQTTPADALFILGDLFEVWVGDDAMDEPG